MQSLGYIKMGSENNSINSNKYLDFKTIPPLLVGNKKVQLNFRKYISLEFN